LVTDHTTVAYLTDVYVLPEYQKKGLGSWMIRCINETMDTWTALRGLILITSNTEAPWYKSLLGADALDSIHGREVKVMVKDGAGR
jgi:GNAT superfamily N-acetyltransferase